MEKQKVSYFWKGLSLFLLGILLGVLIAPAKNGISIGNNNNIIPCEVEDECEPND